MARDEYELNGQQGLDQLLAVLGGEEVQVKPCKRKEALPGIQMCCTFARAGTALADRHIHKRFLHHSALWHPHSLGC